MKFLWNEENIGFSKANNRVLKQATGEYILFLNPDTIVPEDCFEKCISFLQSQNDPAALGVRMIDGAGHFLKESKRAFPSPVTSLYKLAGLTRLFPRSKVFARYYLGNCDEHQTQAADVLAGAFMMVTRNILDKVGGFDEIFFMYGEDVDLSYRIQKAGYRNYYFPVCTIIHFKGESTKKISLHYVRKFYSAMNLFVKKHYSTSKAKVFILLIQAAIWTRAFFSGINRMMENLFHSTKKTKENNSRQSLIVAGEKEFEEVASLMQQAGKGERILSRINPLRSTVDTASGDLQHLPQLVKNYSIKEIIFCEGENSFKNIIDTIQVLPGNMTYMFHGTGTFSIVGSGSKDASGEYVAA